MSVTPAEPQSIRLLAEVEKAGGMFVSHDGGPVGLSLPTDLPYETYESLLLMAFAVHELSRWVIGDLLAAAENEYRNDIYMQAVNLTGLSYHTLENYASASRLVPPQRRRYGVSHSIHREVQSLPADAQKRLLAKAKRDQLTKEAVRELVREEKGVPPQPIARDICEGCGRPL